ncbi:uncharacterized protein VTP21DRAFT_862 [Calcarisporiella thermophila]|uniref:uncharacterized protein n=1 Tax=Calcarisporiella thermophila TaxID=911321 RepID=UPI003742394C
MADHGFVWQQAASKTGWHEVVEIAGMGGASTPYKEEEPSAIVESYSADHFNMKFPPLLAAALLASLSTFAEGGRIIPVKCDARARYLATSNNADIVPYPPVAGQDVTFTLDVHLDQAVDGGTIKYLAIIGPVTMPEERSLCAMVGQPPSCRLQKGDLRLTFKHKVPLPAVEIWNTSYGLSITPDVKFFAIKAIPKLFKLRIKH